MSKNWMRHFELLLVDDKGDGIKISELKVTFNIQKMPATEPPRFSWRVFYL
ncbi:hypothetical protein AB7D45_003471 [Escherichia coli]